MLTEAHLCQVVIKALRLRFDQEPFFQAQIQKLGAHTSSTEKLYFVKLAALFKVCLLSSFKMVLVPKVWSKKPDGIYLVASRPYSNSVSFEGLFYMVHVVILHGACGHSTWCMWS